MVPIRHRTKSKIGKRRSQKKLEKLPLRACSNCNTPLLPHRYCDHCGQYKGRVVKEPRIKIKK